MATILTTERLLLRHAEPTDAAFLRALLNDPGFLANIGDRGVRTIAEAEAYIVAKLRPAYAAGFGMFVVVLDGQPIGLCGFVVRDGLDAPDLGLAFLAAHTRRGYGREAGAAMLDRGRQTLGIQRVLAIIDPGNHASAALLARLGFAEIAGMALPGHNDPSRLFETPTNRSAPFALSAVEGRAPALRLRLRLRSASAQDERRLRSRRQR